VSVSSKFPLIFMIPRRRSAGGPQLFFAGVLRKNLIRQYNLMPLEVMRK